MLNYNIQSRDFAIDSIVDAAVFVLVCSVSSLVYSSLFIPFSIIIIIKIHICRIFNVYFVIVVIALAML